MYSLPPRRSGKGAEKLTGLNYFMPATGKEQLAKEAEQSNSESIRHLIKQRLPQLLKPIYDTFIRGMTNEITYLHI